MYGSEYWTYLLPKRVGEHGAARLTERCLPIGSAQAKRTGLVDDVVAGPSTEFEEAVLEYATRLAGRADHDRMLQRKRTSRRADERRKPLDAYRAEELAEMSRDIFDDRHGFSAARHAFVTKQRPDSTPPRIALHRPELPPEVGGDAAARRAS